MLESLVFGAYQLPGELFRLSLAIIGVAVTTYYDIFNNKNIPNNILYAFCALALLANVIFFNMDIFIFGLATAVVISLLGYYLYIKGQMGAADIFVFASLALLLPIPPSFAKLPFNFPFVAVIFIFASLLFALYTLGYFGMKIAKDRKARPDYKYALLLIPYFVFMYVFITSPLFSFTYFIIVSVAFLSSIFVMMYKSAINTYLAEKIPLSKMADEDVLAIELMDPKFVKKYKLKKVVDRKELSRLKKLKLKALLVYTKLPPFLPFVLAGLFMALLFGKRLFLYF
ncbi:MAG: prepilin peptidase [Candidatus Micrarchaeia archaeon]